MNKSIYPIVYIDRETKKQEIEMIYGAQALQFLYGDSFLNKTVGKVMLTLVSKSRCFSYLFGLWQKSPWTTRRIAPFIKKFNMNSDEFLQPIESYKSFNDFFIRKLKSEARPIAQNQGDKVIAIIPADGRYLFFPRIHEAEGFLIKGEKFDLGKLLGDNNLSAKYEEGTMVIARLCPTDYHRFHFPVDCEAGKVELINGWLYSVNPIALKKNIDIFVQNKRTITSLKTKEFGTVQFIEVGATSVGSIIQTFAPNRRYAKGDEKGYFSFGASTLVLLFEPNSIHLDDDLVAASKAGIEIKCLLGQSMGFANR